MTMKRRDECEGVECRDCPLNAIEKWSKEHKEEK